MKLCYKRGDGVGAVADAPRLCGQDVSGGVTKSQAPGGAGLPGLHQALAGRREDIPGGMSRGAAGRSALTLINRASGPARSGLGFRGAGLWKASSDSASLLSSSYWMPGFGTSVSSHAIPPHPGGGHGPLSWRNRRKP